MTSDRHEEVALLAVALTGEDTFWLCEPVSNKPLQADWKFSMCHWLYPVEMALSRFADASGFTPTDTVFELGADGVSKIERFATLPGTVMAKKQKIGKSTFFFVANDEMQRLNESYKLLLRREAQLPLLAAAKANESGDAATSGAAVVETPAEESVPVRTPARAAVSRRPTASYNSDDTRSHKRKHPPKESTICLAPTPATPFGDHPSSLAFSWTSFYIVHRGSVDFLCPEETGNTFGFRLDRVAHYGYPVFLLFASDMNNSYEVPSHCRGVPALDHASLTGEGNSSDEVYRVLAFTRKTSERGHHSSRRRERLDDESEASESDSESETEEEVFVRRRETTTRARRSTRQTKRTETAVSRTTESSRAGGATTSISSSAEPVTGPALQAISINLWTDPERAVPSADQLAQQYPFSPEAGTTLQTAVFPDGTCVTYSPATATKIAAQLKKAEKESAGGKSANGTSGTGPSADVDMRELLENIRLAKEQSQAS